MITLSAPVKSIMSTDLITVGPEDSMQKVEDIFGRERIHHLPVIDEGKVVGMVSKSDYLFFKRGYEHSELSDAKDAYRLRHTKVSEIMTKGLAKMDPDDHIDIALEVFKENLFHAILITEDNNLRGIVTTLDIIKHLAQE